MLPRVSTALAQFIAPIATSGKQSVPNQQGFERFATSGQKRGRKEKEQSSGKESSSEQQQNQPPPPGPHSAKVIPFPGARGSPPAAPPGGESIPSSISQALLQLMGLLHEQRAALMRWFGPGIYQTCARQQKKNGRVRKGSIIDERAE